METVFHRQVILIAEDSDDDYEITVYALKKAGNLSNAILRCENGQELLDHLNQWSHQSAHQTLAQSGAGLNPHTPTQEPTEATVETGNPGIILLDLNMPGIDGWTALREIKTTEALKHLPVVVLTTSDDEKDIQECYDLGADTYLQKPVSLPRFLDAIKRLKSYEVEIAIHQRPVTSS